MTMLCIRFFAFDLYWGYTESTTWLHPFHLLTKEDYGLRKWGLLALLMILCSGCSVSEEKPSSPSSNQIPKQTPPALEEPRKNQSLSDVEKMLLKPGKFHGSTFNKKVVQHELDQFPEHWTARQVMEALVQLMAEDYRYEVTTLVQYDPQVVLPPDYKESSAQSIKNAKQHMLIQTKNRLLQKAETERDHLLWAQEYLESKWGKHHPVVDTRQLIDHRFALIQQYASDTVGRFSEQSQP